MLGIYDYEEPIRQFSDLFGQDQTAMMNLGQTESAGNPNAVSPAGAEGLFQMEPGTQRDMGVSNPFNSDQSIKGGIGYFSQLANKYDSPLLADVGYNWGQGNLDKLMVKDGTSDVGALYPDLPKETQDHLFKVWHPSSDPENDAWLKGPLPKTPDLGSPSKYANVEIKSASTPSPVTSSNYSKLRDQDLSTVTQEITNLEDQKTRALQGMGQDGHLSDSDAIATALTAILPAILGYGYGGLQGAAMGAQAGAAGATVGLKGMTEQMARRDQTNKLLYEDAKQQLTAKEAEARGIRDKIATEDFTNERDNRLYGSGGLRSGSKMFDEETAQALATRKEDRTDRQNLLVISNPAARRQDLEKENLDLQSGRLKDKEDTAKNKAFEGIPPGFELAEGSIWSPKAIVPVQKRQSAFLQAKDAIQTLKDEMLDPNASLQQKEHAQASAMYALKDLNGLGARFTEQQMALERSRIPAIPDWTSPSKFADWLQFNARGGDPTTALDNLTDWIGKQNTAALGAYGLVPKSIDSGSSDIQQQIQSQLPTGAKIKSLRKIG